MINTRSSPTLLHALFTRADKNAQQTALRWKEGDSWKSLTWAGYGKAVETLAVAFKTLGIGGGDRVALLSTNRPEWVMADLAILALGAVSVPIYPTSPAAQVQYVLHHSGARLIVIGDGGQLEKVNSIWDQCPALERAILIEGAVPSERSRIIPWTSFKSQGEGQGEEGLQAVRETVRAIDPRSMATVVYTSGTTGPPKGAMLSHDNLVAMAVSVTSILDVDENDSSLSFLPLSHIAERLQGELVAVMMGYTVNFGGGLEKVLDDLKEVQPTILLCVPRLWEKIYGRIKDGLATAPPARQKLFAWALDVGWRHFEASQGGGSMPFWLGIQHAIAKKLIYSKVKDKLGMGNTRRFISGAAPLASEIGRFFASLGIPINEAYGQTECTGICNATPLGGLRFGTVGKPVTDVEVKLAEDGEILVRGRNVFLGYLNDPGATAEAVQDGWLHTGDVGTWDEDGYLRITDRKKDIIVTAGGKNVAPQNLENRMKTRPGISQVVVIGDKMPYLVALVTVDPVALQVVWDQKGKGKLPEELATSPEVRALIQDYFTEMNAELGRWEQVKTFAVLPRDFTVEADELTPTLKVRRRIIQKSYASVLDALYAQGGSTT